jgi:glutaminyl-peptide cyclotransferase
MGLKQPVRESLQGKLFLGSICAGIFLTALAGCKTKGGNSTESGSSSAGAAPFMSTLASAPPRSADEAPPPESTGGFDGSKAFAHVAKQVSFGPRPSGSQALAHLQDYLQSELRSYGCSVEIDSFGADTPVGRLSMKNILVKIPGEKPGIILLGTHYDTLLMDNFVGADDAGSSTAVMLELARLLCSQRGKYAVWIAFFDGEEAMKQWSDTDSRYGSRQMAARFANSGDIKKIRAFLLADIVGGRTPHFLRETTSTPTLTDLVWGAAAKLGYSSIFVNDETSAIEDDHDSFLRRNVPSMDVIDLDRVNDVPYWHTPQDTLDKISAKTLAIVGHVFLESVNQLQAK